MSSLINLHVDYYTFHDFDSAALIRPPRLTKKQYSWLLKLDPADEIEFERKFISFRKYLITESTLTELCLRFL